MLYPLWTQRVSNLHFVRPVPFRCVSTFCPLCRWHFTLINISLSRFWFLPPKRWWRVVVEYLGFCPIRCAPLSATLKWGSQEERVPLAHKRSACVRCCFYYYPDPELLPETPSNIPEPTLGTEAGWGRPWLAASPLAPAPQSLRCESFDSRVTRQDGPGRWPPGSFLLKGLLGSESRP